MAKSANLLVDGLGRPDRVGLLLPLHWQTIVLLLAAVAAGADVTVASEPAQLDGCDAAFVLADAAEAALDAGVPDVLGLSRHPLGLAPAELPASVDAYAAEVPAYGDHFGGPRPATARIDVNGQPLPAPDSTGQGGRLLTVLDPADAAGTTAVLAVLAAGGSVVLLPAGDAAAVAAAERVTVTAGITLPGLTSLA